MFNAFNNFLRTLNRIYNHSKKTQVAATELAQRILPKDCCDCSEYCLGLLEKKHRNLLSLFAWFEMLLLTEMV